MSLVKNRYFVVTILLVFVVLFFDLFTQGKVSESNYKPIEYTRTISINGTTFPVGEARTRSELVKGLSGQPSLPENHGLVFFFDKAGSYGIWMKDMNFPIDVLWLDNDMRISYIKEYFLPESYPESIHPDVIGRIVIEFPAGFVESNKIKIGDKVSFEKLSL
jgi:uncharacterized protein